MSLRITSILKKLLFSLSLLVCLIFLAEGAAFLLYRYPTDHPVLRHAVKQFYLTRDSKAIQYEPESASYDPELTYVMRPGTFDFSNREFDTSVSFNSQGFRDDEASLVAPEVVVIGDSYAMGWGVEDHESFPSLLEKQSGMKVLNAGTSSYGTVRELRLLNRIDLSAARFIIIQYCMNDLLENGAYMGDGNQLTIMSPRDYQHAVNINAGRGHYTNFRFLRTFLPEIGESSRTQAEWDTPPDETPESKWSVHLRHSHLFINAFNELGVDLTGKQIIVMELSAWYADIGMFSKVLKAQQEENVLPAGFAKHDLRFVNVHERLTPEDYFVLDDHILPSGHEKVANQLWESMQQ